MATPAHVAYVALLPPLPARTAVGRPFGRADPCSAFFVGATAARRGALHPRRRPQPHLPRMQQHGHGNPPPQLEEHKMNLSQPPTTPPLPPPSMDSGSRSSRRSTVGGAADQRRDRLPASAEPGSAAALVRARAASAVAAAILTATVAAGLSAMPPPAHALTVAPPPINAYAQRRQARAYQRYMRDLEQRFEALPAADLRKVVEKGGGGISVGYRVAGFSAFLASACSTAIVHPLDTLKTRIQARSSLTPSPMVPLTPTTVSVTRQGDLQMEAGANGHSEQLSSASGGESSTATSKDAKMFDGLYNGIQSNILKEAPNAAIYLGVYELIKSLLLSTTTFHDLPLLVFMIAGCLGDAIGSIVRVPAEIVNKRLQLGVNTDWKEAVQEGFFTQEGRQMTLLSWEAVLWRDVPYGGFQIALYEFGRQYILTHPEFPFLHPGLTADVVVGSMAGMIAAVLTTPADVLVTRLSVQNPQSYLETHRYMSVWSTVQRIVNEEGIGGLFAGYLQRGIYYAPLIGLFFSLYEVTRNAVANPHDIIVALMTLQSNISHYLHTSVSASSQAVDHVLPAFVRLAAIASY